MSSVRPNDDFAHYVHAGLHRYDHAAVQEITKRFIKDISQHDVTAENVFLHYDYTTDLFILKCPQMLGPELDKSFAAVLETANDIADGKIEGGTDQFVNVRRFPESLPIDARRLYREEKALEPADTSAAKIPTALPRAHHLVMLSSQISDDARGSIKVTLISKNELLQGPLRKVFLRLSSWEEQSQVQTYKVRAVRATGLEAVLKPILCTGDPPVVDQDIEQVFLRAAQSGTWLFDPKLGVEVGQQQQRQGARGDVKEWLRNVEPSGEVTAIPVSGFDHTVGRGFTQLRHKDAESETSDQSFESAVDLYALLQSTEVVPNAPTQAAVNLQAKALSDTDSSMDEDNEDLYAMLGKPEPVATNHDQHTVVTNDKPSNKSQLDAPEVISLKKKHKAKLQLDRFGLVGHAERQAVWFNEGKAPSMALEGDEWDAHALPSVQEALTSGDETTPYPSNSSTHKPNAAIERTRSNVDGVTSDANWPQQATVPGQSDRVTALPSAWLSTSTQAHAKRSQSFKRSADLIDLSDPHDSGHALPSSTLANGALKTNPERVEHAKPTARSKRRNKSKKQARTSELAVGASSTPEQQRHDVASSLPFRSRKARKMNEPTSIKTADDFEIEACLAYLKQASQSGQNSFRITFGHAETQIQGQEGVLDPQLLTTEAMSSMLGSKQSSSLFHAFKLSTIAAAAFFCIPMGKDSISDKAAENAETLFLASVQWQDGRQMELEIDHSTKTYKTRQMNERQGPIHLHGADAVVDSALTSYSTSDVMTVYERRMLQAFVKTIRISSDHECVLDSNSSNFRLTALQCLTRFTRRLDAVGKPLLQVQLVKELDISSIGEISTARLGSVEQMKSDRKLYWEASLDFDSIELAYRPVRALWKLLQSMTTDLNAILCPATITGERKG